MVIGTYVKYIGKNKSPCGPIFGMTGKIIEFIPELDLIGIHWDNLQSNCQTLISHELSVDIVYV